MHILHIYTYYSLYLQNYLRGVLYNYNLIDGGGIMKFANLEGFKVENKESSNRQEKRTVKAQRSQCRTTLKRQDC